MNKDREQLTHALNTIAAIREAINLEYCPFEGCHFERIDGVWYIVTDAGQVHRKWSGELPRTMPTAFQALLENPTYNPVTAQIDPSNPLPESFLVDQDVHSAVAN